MQTVLKEHNISKVRNSSQQNVNKESSTAKGKVICENDYYNHYYHHYLLIFFLDNLSKIRSNLEILDRLQRLTLLVYSRK